MPRSLRSRPAGIHPEQLFRKRPNPAAGTAAIAPPKHSSVDRPATSAQGGNPICPSRIERLRGQDEAAIVSEDEIRVPSYLPQETVQIAEVPVVATPDCILRVSRDLPTESFRLREHPAHLVAAACVVGER
jgi:hypothetical protein